MLVFPSLHRLFGCKGGDHMDELKTVFSEVYRIITESQLLLFLFLSSSTIFISGILFRLIVRSLSFFFLPRRSSHPDPDSDSDTDCNFSCSVSECPYIHNHKFCKKCDRFKTCSFCSRSCSANSLDNF